MKQTINNWPTTIFLFVTPVVAAAALPIYFLFDLSHWQTWILLVVLFTLTGISTTAGYHRLFSHRSYEAHTSVKLFFLIFGAAAWQGSVIEWCLDHRNHHKFVDTDRDPYSIKKGFSWAHFRWLFYRRERDFDPAKNPDLFSDRTIVWQEKYVHIIASFVSMIMPALIAGLAWGDWFGGFFIAGVLRVVLTHHATFCINSVAHTFGRQPFSDKHSARDNWLNAIVTWGEGYHNYHHEFASDYRNAIRWWQYDPSKWLIFLLEKTGLAWNLKRVGPERILQKKMTILEKMKFYSRDRHLPEAAVKQLEHYREKFREASDRLIALRRSYEAAAAERGEQMKRQLKQMRENMKQAQKDLVQVFVEWEALGRRTMRLATAN